MIYEIIPRDTGNIYIGNKERRIDSGPYNLTARNVNITTKNKYKRFNINPIVGPTDLLKTPEMIQTEKYKKNGQLLLIRNLFKVSRASPIKITDKEINACMLIPPNP
jgi:hypothetical protein